MLAATSCDRARTEPALVGDAHAAAGTEFLAVAGDSTYWVTSGPGGVRVRSAPLFLTRSDGRLTDVYVVDDGVRFDGAEFSSVRVYRRDLLRGDSALVVADGEVPALAARFAATHPDVRPLDDEEASESDAAFVAEHTVGLVAVHGPYVTLDLRTTVDDGGGETRGDRAHRETARRRVVDLRTGRATALATLFGADDAQALVAAGRRAFSTALATLDTMRAPTADDSARVRARAALASLRFDPENFGLTAVDGAPAVQFVARGTDADGVVTLALAAVRARTEPAWWSADVRPLLPANSPNAAQLLARIFDGGGAGTPSTPAEQLVRLDRPPADAALRRALRRAFDRSALGDAVTTSVARRHVREHVREYARDHVRPRAR